MQNIPFFLSSACIAVGTVCDKDEIKKSFVLFFAGFFLWKSNYSEITIIIIKQYSKVNLRIVQLYKILS